MQTRLISITQPLIEGIKTAEELVVHNARISNPENQLNVETGAKLIKYCINKKHWSIFDQVDMTVEIVTSRAIAAQILRHKSMFFQEFSQRYAQVIGIEPLEWRAQGKTNRQVGDADILLSDKADALVTLAQKSAQVAYDQLLVEGIAKECARMVLPLNTTTKLYVKGSARSWIHYFEVRCDAHTQKEHRDIALSIRELFKTQFPVISEALNY
jgi:thymidylate synthase (FAD)